MNKTLIVIIIGLVVIIGAAFLINTAPPEPITSEKESVKNADPAAETDLSFNDLKNLVFEDYDGNPVKLSDFEGRALVINSWAAWCPFCRRELPDFAEIQKEAGDQVVFIAIDRAEGLAIAKKYSDNLGVTNDLVFLLDDNDEFYKAIGGFSMPETIFVTASGKVVQHKKGPMGVQEIRSRVKQLLSTE